MQRSGKSSVATCRRGALFSVLVSFTAIACGDEGDDASVIELGELTEAGITISYDLAPGQSTPLHQVTVDADVFVAVTAEGAAPPEVTLEVVLPSGEGPRPQTGTEPAIDVDVDGPTSVQLRLTNDDAEENAVGTLTVGFAASSTVTNRFEVTGYIVGDNLPDEEEARASWQAQCDDWVATRRELSGPDSVESYDCGTALDINDVGTYYHFASGPTAMIAVELSRGLTVIESVPFHVEGDPQSNPAGAIRSWEDACSARIATIREQYSGRLLGAHCIEPSDVDNNESSFAFRSDLLVQLASLPGAHASGSGYVLGLVSTSVEEALNSWRDACSSWVDDRLAESGLDHLEFHECGEPRDIDPEMTDFHFESEPTMTFALADGILEESRPVTVEGTSDEDISLAVQSWDEACAEALDGARTQHGELFVGGLCPKPRDVNPNDVIYQYRSDVILYLAAPDGD